MAIAQAASEVVARVLRDGSAGVGAPVVIHRVCGNDACERPWSVSWTPRGDEVVVGHRVPPDQVVDVALLKGGSVVAAVLVSDGTTKRDPTALGNVPWVELDATAVVASPHNWRPVAEREPDRWCPTCVRWGKGEDRWARIRRIAADTGQMVPQGKQSAYWAEPYRCYSKKCGAEMLVYSWTGHLWMTDDPPPEPRPASLEHRFSKQAEGKYWANVCPKCGALQGENFVYQPDGPLPFRMRGS